MWIRRTWNLMSTFERRLEWRHQKTNNMTSRETASATARRANMEVRMTMMYVTWHNDIIAHITWLCDSLSVLLQKEWMNQQPPAATRRRSLQGCVQRRLTTLKTDHGGHLTWWQWWLHASIKKLPLIRSPPCFYKLHSNSQSFVSETVIQMCRLKKKNRERLDSSRKMWNQVTRLPQWWEWKPCSSSVASLSFIRLSSTIWSRSVWKLLRIVIHTTHDGGQQWHHPLLASASYFGIWSPEEENPSKHRVTPPTRSDRTRSRNLLLRSIKSSSNTTKHHKYERQQKSQPGYRLYITELS